MSELARYNGQVVKIGTCEDMYYLRYDQRHLVTAEPNSVDPVRDAEALRFRFPWPDEDDRAPGDFADYSRGEVVPGDDAIPEGVEHNTVQFAAQTGYLVSLPCPESVNWSADLHVHRNGWRGRILLEQQRRRNGQLVPVFRCGGCGAKWREEDPDAIERLANAYDRQADEVARAEAIAWQDGGRPYFGHRAGFYLAIAKRLRAGLQPQETTTDTTMVTLDAHEEPTGA